MIKSHRYRKYFPFIASFICAAIFAIKWIHCLPFSDFMPVISCEGTIRFGSYMVYAREPFSFLSGIIKSFTFPFNDADVLRAGAIPLFAIPFKCVSKLCTPLSHYYYFVLVELSGVFFAAYFTYRLLQILKIEGFLLKLLGTILCALSFVILIRSQHDHALILIHVPIYLAFGYAYIQLARKPSVYHAIALLSVFLITALADPYILFGISFMASICILGHFFNFIFMRTHAESKKLILISVTFLIAVFLAFKIISLTAAYDFPKGAPWANCLNFGFGAGYHVADVFSLIIPPGSRMYPNIYPDASYLANIGFPVTTDNLQLPGQHTGFVFLGTTVCSLIFVLAMLGAVGVFRNFQFFFTRLKLRIASKLYLNILLSPETIMGIAAFALYVISWGHVIHIFGHKVSGVLFTPAGILAELWPKFIYIRSIGRLAMPFSLYVVIATIYWLNSYLIRHKHIYNGRIGKSMYLLIVVFLIAAHIYEVRGYLRPVKATPNIILSVFNKDEINAVKTLLKDKKALFLVPGIREKYAEWDIKNGKYGETWDIKCFSLVYYSGIPSNLEYDARIAPHSEVIKSDAQKILEGNISDLVDRYGDIAVAAPCIFARRILSRTNIPLEYYRIQDFGILRLKK